MNSFFFFKSLFRFWIMAYSYQIIKQNQENEVFLFFSP